MSTRTKAVKKVSKKAAAPMKIDWAIYKKLKDLRFPGDYWAGPYLTLNAARAGFERWYRTYLPGSQDFRIVRMEYYEEVP